MALMYHPKMHTHTKFRDFGIIFAQYGVKIDHLENQNSHGKPKGCRLRRPYLQKIGLWSSNSTISTSHILRIYAGMKNKILWYFKILVQNPI